MDGYMTRDERDHADLLAVLEQEARTQTHEPSTVSMSQVLARAQAFLRTPEHWVRFSFHDELGECVRMCSLGAISAQLGVVESRDPIYHPGVQNAARLLMMAIKQTDLQWEAHVPERAHIVPTFFVSCWNDDRGVDHDMVCAAFRRAVTLAKREEADAKLT